MDFTNRTILHYQILEKIGEGGMGVVYKAEDTKLKRLVAIKFLPPHIAGDDEERKRFKIEAQAAAALNHRTIATIHAIEEFDDVMFIVMEYIEGKDLQDLIKSKAESLLPMTDIVDYSRQIAEGLKAAHSKGIVHRDIKSTNIMIAGDGTIKIMDFGLALMGKGSQITRVGTTIGTAAYMSPEQASGQEVDQRTDIWSWGVVLYEMLTGYLPFGGGHEQAVMYSILNEEPRPTADVRKDIPPEVSGILRRALSKKKEDRYSTINEPLEVLRSLRARDTGAGGTIPRMFRRKGFMVVAVAFILLASASVSWWFYQYRQAEEVRRQILPQVEAIVKDIPWTGEGSNPWFVFGLAEQARKIIPDDPMLKILEPKYSRFVRILSDPTGARVYAKPYGDTMQEWRYFGTTPLDRVNLPLGFSKVKLEKESYRTALDVIWNLPLLSDTLQFGLASAGSIPDEMELVSQSSSLLELTAAPAGLHIPGLEKSKSVPLGDFLMDRYEVTNASYKRFVISGGYQKRQFWKYPFVREGRPLTWESAMKLFTDRTGLPGPATWEVGSFSEGQGDLPVTGVSWYEAAAFAEFSGKSLPTLYHWDRVALTWASPMIVPSGNFGGKGPRAVGQLSSMNRFGVYDLAGNAREWCYNETNRGGRFIMGGGWNDAVYSFNDAYAQQAFDRSPTNGFRCIRYLHGETGLAEAQRGIDLPFRDFLREKPVSNATFEYFRSQYNYDRTPLNAVIEAVDTTESWVRQKISFDAAYGKERMTVYLFLPRGFTPPIQPVIYFPGSGAIHTRSSNALDPGSRDFLVKSGRALVWPIYKSTYERGDDLKSDYPEETNFWKEHIIMWTKDFSRSIDYLETRSDIDSKKVAYFGASWGGAMGGIIPAMEKRIKVVVLLVAGLEFQKSLPEVEPVNLLPHITVPVLMLNGKYDFFFPYETAQRPFFELLGTPKKDKKIFVYENGHTVPVTEMAKETLAWLDRYLGRVMN